MTYAGLADHRNRVTDEPNPITRTQILTCFVIVAWISVVLRIFYAGHLYEDDGLWFTAGEQLVRGKALYREIYFDKPPGLAWLYGFLFWIFGAHVLTIRLFTIAYSIAVSAVLYLFGSKLYDRTVGLLAAMLFAIFSTTYTTGHVQGLGTDFLMALPYTAGAFLITKSILENSKATLWAFSGGLLSGLAFQINPKGIFNIVFLALLLVGLGWQSRSRRNENSTNGLGTASSLRLFFATVAGLVIGSLPFLIYIAATRSFREYWSYVWVWGTRYGSYNSLADVLVNGLTRSIDYFALNNTLLIALGFVIVVTARTLVRRRTGDPDSLSEGRFRFDSDLVVILWLVASYAGLLLGGRLYSHYFFQIIPSLCLIGARGLIGIRAALKYRDATARRLISAVIVLGFAFTLIRFHGRTVILAADFIRGKKSAATAGWFHERIDREERMVAAVVRELPEGEEAVDRVGLEAMRAPREPAGPEDYLFVWGYRPEIYYFSGLVPATRYLSTQPLTGVPADVHYFSDTYRSVLDSLSTATAREQLVKDLEATKPKYIVDELGMFNADLSINSYPELKELMEGYKATGPVARFMVYTRRDLLKKNLRKSREKDSLQSDK